MAEKRTPRVEELFQKLNQYETDENGNQVSWASLHRDEFIAELMALDKSEFDWRKDTCMGLYLPACIIGTNDVLLTDKFLKATKLNLRSFYNGYMEYPRICRRHLPLSFRNEPYGRLP